MTSSSLATEAATASDVRVTDEALIVELRDGRTVSVPLKWYPRLAEGRPPERRNWQFIGPGTVSTGPILMRTSLSRVSSWGAHRARAQHRCGGGEPLGGVRPTNEWSRRARDRKGARLIRNR